MPRLSVPLLLAVALLAPAGADAAAAARPAPKPAVVVAVADSGINPYHEVFRRPHLTRHPCTWVAGFTDCSIPALRLTLGKYQDYRAAVAADRDVWDAVDPHQWYWIPGTNIIGAVCDHNYRPRVDTGGSGDDPDNPGATACILDNDGHGTGTASAVLSEAPDALLLVHEGDAAARDFATFPVTPDVQSHSWAAPTPLPLQVTEPVLEDEEVCPSAQRRPETLYFLAAGNEAPFPALLDCERSNGDVHVVGGGYPGYWSTDSWSTFDFASWYCRPVALAEATKGTRESCGTSFAAPTAAGAAAAALLDLRRRDGYTGRSTRSRVSRTVTRAAFEAALQRAASYAPKSKYPRPMDCAEATTACLADNLRSRWAPLPEPAAFLFWGYGWLDSTVTPAIVACALGRSCPEKSPQAQAYNQGREDARGAQEVDLPMAPQRDAGSGRDAGADRASAVPIVAGKAYDARIEPHGFDGDVDDWYAIRLRAGQRLSVTSAGHVLPQVPVDVTPVSGCWFLLDAAGEVVGGQRGRLAMRHVACDSTDPNPPPADVRVPRTGTYALVYSSHNGVPHDYRFTVTVAR